MDKRTKELIKQLISETKKDVSEIEQGKKDIEGCKGSYAYRFGCLIGEVDNIINQLETIMKIEEKLFNDGLNEMAEYFNFSDEDVKQAKFYMGAENE